ncbi:MAG: hypothetical protein JWQ96_378 [Segetibacter sp.]|nr:hypothetical protein [Segetibacter sp.]
MNQYYICNISGNARQFNKVALFFDISFKIRIMQEQQNQAAGNDNKPTSKGETISQLAHRHLADESHVTTDEEFKNARIEFSSPPAQDEENLFEVDNTTVLPPFPGENSLATEDDDKDLKRQSPNPYDLLGS